MNLLPLNTQPVNQQKLSFTSKLKPSPMLKNALTPPFKDSFELSKAVKIITNDGKNDIIDFAAKFNNDKYESLSLLVNGEEVDNCDYNYDFIYPHRNLFSLKNDMEGMLIGLAEKISNCKNLYKSFTKDELKIIEPVFKAFQQAIANFKLEAPCEYSDRLTDLHVINHDAEMEMQIKLKQYGIKELSRIESEIFG